MDNLNPGATLENVRVGDVFMSSFNRAGEYTWWNESEVLEVGKMETRFGKPDRVLTVKIVTNSGRVIDKKKQIWFSQLRKGLV